MLAEFAGAWLLVRLLKFFGQPPERVLIYLWSPLLIFEVAHAGHVDGVVLPLLILALWARSRISTMQGLHFANRGLLLRLNPCRFQRKPRALRLAPGMLEQIRTKVS